MKMEDEFNLPVSVGWLSNLFDELSPQQKKAAAHAINCHDELVDALQHCLENIKGTPLALKVKNVLDKAKGER